MIKRKADDHYSHSTHLTNTHNIPVTSLSTGTQCRTRDRNSFFSFSKRSCLHETYILVVREGLTEKVIFQQKPEEVRDGATWISREACRKQRGSNGRGQGARICLTCSRGSKESNVTGMERARGEEVGADRNAARTL